MTPDPVAAVRRYHAALNDYDAEVVRRMFAPDAIYVSPGVNGRIDGRDAIIAAFSAYFAEHPDQRAVDDSIVPLGPRSARSIWRLEATARSSGTLVSRSGTETVQFDAQGLITRVEVEDA
jgi:uncharacterized protein (TIGR02246 family)